MTVNIILLSLFIFSAILTVTAKRMIRATIGLAVTSAILAIIIYRLDSPIAAVFELSVCTGLISVLFVSIVSLVQRITDENMNVKARDVLRRFWFLPMFVFLMAVIVSRITIPADLVPAGIIADGDVRAVLWNERHLDLLGQIVVLLAGAIGVVILFKDKDNG